MINLTQDDVKKILKNYEHFKKVIAEIPQIAIDGAILFKNDILQSLSIKDNKRYNELLAEYETIKRDVKAIEELTDTYYNTAQTQLEVTKDELIHVTEIFDELKCKLNYIKTDVTLLLDSMRAFGGLAIQSTRLYYAFCDLFTPYITPSEQEQLMKGINELLKMQANNQAGINDIKQGQADQEANNQARHDEIKQGQADIKESVEDRNKHRHEKWATVPDCVRLVFENKEIDNQDYGLPYPDKLNGLSRDSLRVKTQAILRAKGKREKSYKNSKYYNTRDIAEAIHENVKVYPVNALFTEFDCIGKQEEDIANRLE